MSYLRQRCRKRHDHWVIRQVKLQECGMACVGILLKNRGITASLPQLRKVSQQSGGSYRPDIDDVVRGERHRIEAQHMMAAIMRYDEGQVVTQQRAGEFGTQAYNLASILNHFGVKAVATYEPGEAKAVMRKRAKRGTASIALVRWVEAGHDAGGHFVVIDGATTHLFSHTEYCIMDPTYGLSTQALPTRSGHPSGRAPEYHPPESGGAVGYLTGWHVVTL